jgi:hypothetical protein
MKNYLKLILMLLLITVASSSIAFNYEPAKGGLGAQLDIPKTSVYPRIVNTVPGFPAARIGLKEDDLITEIEGQSTQYLSIEDVVARLRGSPGTTCHMVIRRIASDYRVSFIRQRLYPEWASGKVDNYYHLRAAEQINYWYPTPGYVFVYPGTSDLSTQWKAGQQHPYYKVISANEKNRWVPLPGYRFIRSTSLATVWTPGIFLESSHIISGDKPETWHAAPGYKFESENSLKVVSANDPWNDTIVGVIEAAIAGWIESWFGDNFVSDYLYGKAWAHGKNVIESVFKP